MIGVEDEEFGQRLKAFVVLEAGTEVSDEADLDAHVKANLAGYKTPREVEFLDELPRNATGKVLKRDLRSARRRSPPDRLAQLRRCPSPREWPPVPSRLPKHERTREAAESGRRGHREMHGVAEQALEWVKVCEERVAAAEARAEQVREELKERAMGTLRERLRRGRAKRLGAPSARRGCRAEAKVAAAEAARDRAEKAFEELQRSARRPSARRSSPRRATAARAPRREASEAAEAATRRSRSRSRRRGRPQARERIEAEADRRVAAAEQRAAEAEAAAEPSRTRPRCGWRPRSSSG